MKRLIAFWRLAIATLFCVLLGIVPTHACTTFVLQGADQVYFGRGFAGSSEDAQVVVNPRVVQQSSLVFPRSVPAKWVSKYGSVTFNSGGWELPTGGMNEAGLVVENMWLDQTQWPTAPTPATSPAYRGGRDGESE